MNYYTSDFHFGSAILLDRNVVGNKARKFQTLDEMHAAILAAAGRAKKGDTIYHLGDLACVGIDRQYHGLKSRKEIIDIVDSLPCNKIFLEGNHDKSNCGFSSGKLLMAKVGKYNVAMQHMPSDVEDYIDVGQNINICGHVHTWWKVMYDHVRNVININVGLDRNHFKMYSEAELISLIDLAVEYVQHVNKTFDYGLSYDKWLKGRHAKKAAQSQAARIRSITWKLENKPDLVTADEKRFLARMAKEHKI